MKQLVLFVFIFLFGEAVFAQNYINEVVIQHELREANAYSWFGHVKQPKASIRTMDSLHIGMIILKTKYPESGDLAPMGIDTLYVQNGYITELIKFQNCYKTQFDSKGRVTEKRISRSPDSPMKEIQIFQYDFMDFPVYSMKVEPGNIFLQDSQYHRKPGNYEENLALPHYNALGVLDTIAYSGSYSTRVEYATVRQDSYKNGDSIIITRTFRDLSNEFRREDYFLRTVHNDTVQIRFYQGRIGQSQQYTSNQVNGLEVESYFESRGMYTHATFYNPLGLPVKQLGFGVTNEGSGDLVTHYEYYTIDPVKKNKFCLVKME